MNRRQVLCVVLFAAVCLSAVGVTGCSHDSSFPVSSSNGLSMVSRASGRYFQVFSGGKWQGHLVKGANIGASLPGYWFGDLAITGDMYSRWFEQISAMNANTILVYTLMKPAFYNQLDRFNKAHPDRRLWLMQQVWPNDENSPPNLYLPAYAATYRKEIALDVKALMGKVNIGERVGLAWGNYTTNVMPYTMGMVIGRELTSEEVRQTSNFNPQKNTFQGKYVKTTPVARPIEVWCADMADTLATHLSRGGWAVPVGYVSWPTLDPLDHPTEFTPGGVKSREVDDSQVLDPRDLGPGPSSLAGIFGVYQIYPYYPEFIYRQPSYASYTDSQGILRYGGYLKNFMTVIPDYPALVGEYGLPTSISVTHAQPEGLNQGGLDEVRQGTELQRMYKAIANEGYAGGLFFEWADEWAKNNWVVVSYMIPFDRHVLWHDVLDPEECFGILSYDPKKTPYSGMSKLWSRPGTASGKAGDVNGIYATANETYLYLGLDVVGGDALQTPQGGLSLSVGISTLGKDHGTRRLPVPGLPDLPSGAEFLLNINGPDSALLLVRPDYSRANSKFWAARSFDTNFEHVVYVINRAQESTATGQIFPAISYDQSVLQYGDFNPASKDYNSIGLWYYDRTSRRLMVRLPWGMLNVSDPSSLQVILDNTRNLPPAPGGMRNMGINALSTITTPGVQFFAATTTNGALSDFAPRDPGSKGFDPNPGSYRWGGWQQPSVKERLKQSYPYMKQLYGSCDSTAVPPPPQN